MKTFIIGPTKKDENFSGQAKTKFPLAMNWYVNGKLHREDGPARIFDDQTIVIWAYKGMYHRIGGPAIVYIDDRLCDNLYYIHGHQYDKENYWKHPLVVQHKLNEIKKL